MSASALIADAKAVRCRAAANDVMGHNLTHAPQQTPLLFDHLIGEGEQRRWHGEAERLGGPEIDH